MIDPFIKHHFPLPPIPRDPFVCGLDLGKFAGHSALAVLQRVESFGPRDPVTFAHPHSWSLQVRHLQRFPLGLSYPVIVDRVAEIVSRPEIHSQGALVVDATGLGAPVVDLLRKARLPVRLVPIVITSGEQLSAAHGNLRVPRANLIAALSLGLQLDRLHVAAAIPGSHLLFQELLRFQIRPTAADSASARDSEHDDLVLSVALANWYANHHWK